MLIEKVNKGAKLVLEEGDAELINENFSEDDRQLLRFICEEMLGGNYETVAPESIGALTDAPIFTDNLVLADDGTVAEVGSVWWYPNYMVAHFGTILLRDKEVFFHGAPENKP